MSVSSPPKWADRLLVKICPQDLVEEIQGDLHEAFFWRVDEKGQGYATRKFITEVLLVTRFYKPKIMKNSKFALFKNYMKTGFRFLWKTRNFSSLNILGLVVGITTCWLSFYYLYDELSYDSHHQNKERIFRLAYELEMFGRLEKMGGASYVMGEVLPKEVPGIVDFTRFKSAYGILKIGEEADFNSFHLADPGIFNMFDFKIIEGSKAGFGGPDNVLISRSMAIKLNVGLDELEINYRGDDRRFKIIGIYEDLPHNSTLRPEILASFDCYTSKVSPQGLNEWFNINMNLLFLLQDPEMQKNVEDQITAITRANGGEEDDGVVAHLQSLTDIHFDEDYGVGNGLRGKADMDVIWIVGIVGLLCLLISAINYSNFAVGNYLVRSREVAVRKVVGAHRQSIFSQFVTESFISTSVAAVLSLIAIFFLMPVFADYMQKSYYEFSDLFEPNLILAGLVIVFAISLISGLYPALVLSKFKVSNALRGSEKIGGGSWLSRIYLTLQFGIAIFLIVGMLASRQQLGYLLGMDMGYEDENVLTFDMIFSTDEKVQRLSNLLSAIPGVESFAPNSGFNGTDYSDGDIRFGVRHLRTNDAYMDLLQISLLEGRNFNADLPSDIANSAIVNETFVKKAQLDDPIGKVVPFKYGEFKNPTIIGVVKDFNFKSPKHVQEPLIMYQSPQYVLQSMLVKINENADSDVIYQIEQAYKEVFSPFPFDSTWLTEYNDYYLSMESRIKKIATTGSLIAVFLAALGLLSMVGTYINQRMKDICIRKINGASARDLYVFYSRKFVTWILMGFNLGCLPAYYLVSGWLDNYPNRIDLSFDLGLIALMICIAVFLITMLAQLTKIVLANPVTFLRDE